ncbi:unnamed protein product [Candidula unifasciata]|uniref:Uncharacterized protein n=1 Tax=Candidula unifasciata TaxID=100452 RepID=A0A8S3Z9S7_9EUPU|nr:unnamed protein product [Candidula unifasciata]
MTSLKCASRCYTMCGIAVYSRVNNTCVTFRNRIHQSGFTVSRKAGCVVIYKNDAAFMQDWTLVFRAQAGIGHPVVDYWSSKGKQDDNPLSETFPASCLRFDKSSSCDRHFRSYILDNWKNIVQVRYSLYREGKEVSYIVFNGTGSNGTSWFQQSRILSTSWTKLKNEGPIEHFTLLVFENDVSKRSFYIFGPHNGCGTDYALTFIIERDKDACAEIWQVQSVPVPVFIYSLKDSYVTVKRKGNEYIGLADAAAVFVKFGDIFADV